MTLIDLGGSTSRMNKTGPFDVFVRKHMSWMCYRKHGIGVREEVFESILLVASGHVSRSAEAS